MAEKSQFWYTDGFTGATGDGAAPYTQEEFRAYNAARLGEGVIAGAGNGLAVSGSASPLSVATGRAQVAGFHYWNDSAKSLAVTTPVVGTTGGRVILRANWTAATVRLFVLLNTDGNAGIPALTQNAGVTYEISLASFTITTGGVITLTDTRTFVPDRLSRQGNSATSWTTPGTTNYETAIQRRQAGTVNCSVSSGSGNVSVTFPAAFTYNPLVLITLVGSAGARLFAYLTAVSTTGFTAYINADDGASTWDGSDYQINWLAIGV
ncbi:MAG: hypothetical protein KC425_19690 [Anaerolineales bacterium]|nr:hypothetical protein [Anaerolineales bacterium]